MTFPYLTPRYKLLAATLIVLYLVGYGWARSKRILIHRSSYATNTTDGSKRYFHQVTAANFGQFGSSPSGLPLFDEGCSLLFTPLRWVESAVWHFTPTRRDNASIPSAGRLAIEAVLVEGRLSLRVVGGRYGVGGAPLNLSYG